MILFINWIEIKMSETAIGHEQYQKNIDLLRQAEDGEILESAYAAAVELDPRLEAAEIVPLAEDAPGFGVAWPVWWSKSGKHKVEIRMGDYEEAHRKIDELFDSIPGAKRLFAEIVGVA